MTAQTKDLGYVHRVLDNWRGRSVFVRERGAGYTDAYIAVIDDQLLYWEDEEAIEEDSGVFRSDMVLLMYLRTEAGRKKVFGYADGLVSAEVGDSVVSFEFSHDVVAYTIALISS